MASSEDIVRLYMAMIDHDANEAKANLDELSRRTLNLSSSQLIIGIQTKELKLLEFVKILGEYITHEESKQRKNGNYRLIRD